MNFLKDPKTFGPTIGLKTIVVDIEERGFYSFAENVIELSVNETNKICSYILDCDKNIILILVPKSYRDF